MSISEEAHELIELRHQLQELMSTPGWQVWRDQCQARINAKEREILAGLETLEDYRYNAGWIEGARFVLDAHEILDIKIERRTSASQGPGRRAA